jgi:NADH dehydrogenase
MSRWARRGGIGLLAGLVSGVILAAAPGEPGLGLALGAVVGVGYGLAVRPTTRDYLGRMAAGAALGAPLWALIDVIVLPLLSGLPPQWTVDGVRALFPTLIGWMLYGAALALLTQALNDLARRLLGPEPELAAPPPPAAPTRIVIVGGGFAGVTTAQHLERRFGPDRSVAITLVSDANALLFTPMLAEVAGSSLEPTQISTPLRTSLRRTTVIRRRVEAVDLPGRRLRLQPDADRAAAPGDADPDTLPFDHLVLAVGSVSNFLGLTGVQQNAFDFKSLADAIRIRNHVIDAVERADREPDPAARRALLTIVIVGGGFAGVELAGALNDFVRGALVYYPNIRPEELTVMLVHSRDSILPELGESLGAYALQRMAERGVTFKLNARVVDARPGVVSLSPAEEIPAATLVWTAGVAPNPLLRTLGVELDRRGALPVDVHLAAPGWPGLWALGDCAAVVDARTGKPCPPTAQFALREAKTLAHNIHATLRRRPLTPFHFDALGVLAVVGHQTACAELAFPPGSGRTLRFSGLLAWLMWRGVYLSKLPGLERKVRVLIAWVIELFFPRDIVQTVETSRQPSAVSRQGT